MTDLERIAALRIAAYPPGTLEAATERAVEQMIAWAAIKIAQGGNVVTLERLARKTRYAVPYVARIACRLHNQNRWPYPFTAEMAHMGADQVVAAERRPRRGRPPLCSIEDME